MLGRTVDLFAMLVARDPLCVDALRELDDGSVARPLRDLERLDSDLEQVRSEGVPQPVEGTVRRDDPCGLEVPEEPSAEAVLAFVPRIGGARAARRKEHRRQRSAAAEGLFGLLRI